MEECTHDCSSCTASCGGTAPQENAKPKLVSGASVGKVVAVMGSKGGVGRSTIACALAAELQRRGRRTAVLDADITGSSVPAFFGVDEICKDSEECLYPAKTHGGTQLMSVELALEKARMPLAWRGELLAEALVMFWSEVYWDKVDVMLVDMPAGIADVPIISFQALPLSGIVVVSQPTDISAVCAAKSVDMAKIMNIPVLALAENMCPASAESDRAEALARSAGVDCVVHIPCLAEIPAAEDRGEIETLRIPELAPLADAIEKIL